MHARRLLGNTIIGSGLALSVGLSAAQATSLPAEQRGQLRTVAYTFRLQVSGTPDARATFWVAYGPLQGRFGVIRLRSTASGQVYTATRRLPLHARAYFAYLAGQGTLHTKAGIVPGNPVTVIQRVGPFTVQPGRGIPAAHWAAPVG
jgi:hypothetical protein